MEEVPENWDPELWGAQVLVSQRECDGASPESMGQKPSEIEPSEDARERCYPGGNAGTKRLQTGRRRFLMKSFWYLTRVCRSPPRKDKRGCRAQRSRKID